MIILRTLLLAFPVLLPGFCIAKDDKPSVADRSAFGRAMESKPHLLSFQKFVWNSFDQSKFDITERSQSDVLIFTLMRNRKISTETIIRSQRNNGDAIQEMQSAIKNNEALQPIEQFLGYMDTAYTFYQGAEVLLAVYDTKENAARSGVTVEDYLIALEEAALLPQSESNLLVDDKNSESNSAAREVPQLQYVGEGSNSLKPGAGDRKAGDAASSPQGRNEGALSQLLYDWPNITQSRIELGNALYEDVSWLEENPNPDWSTLPDIRFTEGEIRLKRAFESLGVLYGFGPTAAEKFVKEQQWGSEDFFSSVLDGGLETWITKHPDVLTAVEIFVRPTVLGDGTIGTEQFSNEMRRRLLNVAPNYIMWRTRKPMASPFSIDYSASDGFLDWMECPNGCIVPYRP